MFLKVFFCLFIGGGRYFAREVQLCTIASDRQTEDIPDFGGFGRILVVAQIVVSAFVPEFGPPEIPSLMPGDATIGCGWDIFGLAFGV
jgi:hypothetical protein